MLYFYKKLKKYNDGIISDIINICKVLPDEKEKTAILNELSQSNITTKYKGGLKIHEMRKLKSSHKLMMLQWLEDMRIYYLEGLAGVYYGIEECYLMSQRIWRIGIVK